VWLAGTARPPLIAWALFGPLISGWQFLWLVWLGLTISYQASREIVQVFARALARILRKQLLDRLEAVGRALHRRTPSLLKWLQAFAES